MAMLAASWHCIPVKAVHTTCRHLRHQLSFQLDIVRSKALSRCRPLHTAAARTMATARGAVKDPALERFHQHQKSAARLSVADEARMLMELARTGVLSTISASAKAAAGFPVGSVVEFAVDAAGRPVFALSSLSGHTKDLRTDSRCSLTVVSPTFKGMSDARFTLTGHVSPVEDAERASAREAYLEKNPDSFWVDFGDFTWFRMNEVVEGRFNGGFARAATLSSTEYVDAQPDFVAAFSTPIAKHMNDDHADSTRAMVEHYTGLPVERAAIIDLDRFGLNIQAAYQGDSVPVRLPFPRPAEDRKAIKTLIVEMTQAAAKATASDK